jgi:hypothetical protein
MAESYQEKRRKELGLSGSSSSSFQQKRQMELGMIKDTRSFEEKNPYTVQSPGFQAMGGNSLLSQYQQNNPNVQPSPEPADERNKVQKALDYVFQENPVSRAINYPFAKAAEYSIPDAPMIKQGKTVQGSSAREEHARLNPVMPTGNETFDKMGNIAGQIGSYFLNPAAPGQGPVALYNAARNIGATKPLNALSQKVTNPIANRALNEAAKEGVTAAAYAVPNSLLQGESSAPEIARNVAIEGGIGLATGGLLGSLAGPVKKAFQTWSNRGNAPSQVQELLSLPAPNPKALREGTQASGDVIYAPGKVETLGLPEPNMKPPTTARVERKANPHTQKFERLIETANQQQFTPGRELEELEELWGRMADPEDPGLNELIDLAYPKRKEVNPDMVQRAKITQQKREIYGVGMPVKSQSDRYQPTIGQAAMPETKLGRAQAAPKQEVLQSTPQPPEASVKSQTPRVRDRLYSALDEAEAEARERLRKKKGRLSSNPIDIYADYAVIGAAKIGKGAVKFSDWAEQMVKEFGEEVRPYLKRIYEESEFMHKHLTKAVERDVSTIESIDATKLKDLTNINLNTGDVYRNLKKVFGNQYDTIKRTVLDPFDDAKGRYVKEQKDITDKLYNDVVKKLGIKKGSKESALVQKYGEGQIDLDQLKKESPGKWKDIVKANEWFRREYDTLLDRVNQTVKEIYPTNPDKLVPKRKDYYRHFQELTGFSGLKKLFDTPSAIDPSLSGLSPYTKPKTKWASFKQKRGLGEFKNDAVGGFLEYVPAASYAIHIDPQIGVFRGLAKELAEDTGDSRNLNNTIKFLQNYANDLAGKTSPFDRWVEELGGRKTLQVMSWANNRVKSNVILGNLRSTLSQMANIPNGIAFGGTDAIPGMMRTMQSVIAPNPAMEQSRFLAERYVGKNFRRFDEKMIEQPRKFAEWMMETSDRIGTSFIWNTAYAKGLKQGVDDPVRFADNETRRLVSGRGVGEVPLIQKSKVFQVVAPFTLEVGNLWRVMKDFVDAKQFGSLATLFVANFLFNKGYEKLTGSGVVFDPIDAFWDAMKEEDASPLQRGGRVAGEVLSNVPLGQNIASIYPEYGMNIYGIELPSRKELFGDKDPTRFGGGVLLERAVKDPLFNVITPFGGNQLRKSIQGLDASIRGGKYTDNVLTTGLNIEKPQYQFDVKSPTDKIQASLFGPAASSQGQKYYDNERRPLSEKQTQGYVESGKNPELYDNLMLKREVETLRRKISDVRNDKSKSYDQKVKEIEKYTKQIEKLLQSSS